MKHIVAMMNATTKAEMARVLIVVNAPVGYKVSLHFLGPPDSCDDQELFRQHIIVKKTQFFVII